MQQLHVGALTEGESKSQVCLSAAEEHKTAYVSPRYFFPPPSSPLRFLVKGTKIFKKLKTRSANKLNDFDFDWIVCLVFPFGGGVNVSARFALPKIKNVPVLKKFGQIGKTKTVIISF